MSSILKKSTCFIVLGKELLAAESHLKNLYKKKTLDADVLNVNMAMTVFDM